MTDEKEFLEGFQAEIVAKVAGGLIVELTVIFNEDFDNELSVGLRCGEPTPICCWDGGFLLGPSFVHFQEDNSVEFGLVFTDPSTGSGSHYQEFVESLLLLAWLGFRPCDAGTSCPEFAADMGVVMDRLAEMESTTDLDITEYYGFFY